MAVNPLIAMSVKIPDFDTSDVRLREAQAQNLEQQALERERARKQEEETLKLVQQYGSDITPETLKTIAAKNPRAALQMQTLASKQQADKLAAEKAAFEKDDAQFKLMESKRKAQREQLQEWSNLASGITDEASYYRAIKLGLDRGLPIEVAKQLAQTPYDPKNVQQFSQQFMTAKERLDLEEALEKKEYEAKRRPQELAKLGAEVANVTRGADGMTPGERVSQNAPTAEQKNFKEFYQQYIAANNLPDSPKSYMAARQEFEKKPVTPIPGRDIPLPKEVEEQRKRMAAAGASGGGDADEGLIKAIIANPLAYDDLTPTVRSRVIPKLQARGFDQFGKPVSSGAIDKMAENAAAIASLQDLRQTLKENEQFIGPIAGFAAINPYSDARKAQAKIDLVKQRVGKALEGGVLRKEDEEKYKKILATLNDTPETAIAKVDGLIATLERDSKIYQEQQRAAGRRMPSQKAKPAEDLSKLSTEELLKRLK